MKILILVFLLCFACADNLPTNETDQPVAGAPAAEPLFLGVSAKVLTEITLSRSLLGVAPYCNDPTPTQTSCHSHAAPWADNAPWYYFLRVSGNGLTQQTSTVFFPQHNGPAIYLGTVSCSQTSCTSLQ